MDKNTLNLPTQKDMMKVPTDEIKEAVVLELEVKTWFEITKDELKKTKLNDPQGKVLVIKYDTAGFIRQQIIPLGDKLTTRSKYGRFLIKYNLDESEDFKPLVGMKVKVQFDDKGNSDIILAK